MLDGTSTLKDTLNQHIMDSYKDIYYEPADSQISILKISSHSDFRELEEAKKIAQLASKDESSSFTLVLKKIVKKNCNIQILKNWNEYWINANKNEKIREFRENFLNKNPTLNLSNRREQVILSRVRIGQSLYIHAYHLNEKKQTICDICVRVESIFFLFFN